MIFFFENLSGKKFNVSFWREKKDPMALKEGPVDNCIRYQKIRPRVYAGIKSKSGDRATPHLCPPPRHRRRRRGTRLLLQPRYVARRDSPFPNPSHCLPDNLSPCQLHVSSPPSLSMNHVSGDGLADPAKFVFYWYTVQNRLELFVRDCMV